MPTTRTRGAETGLMIACTVGAMAGVTPVVMITFGLFLGPIAEAFHWSRGFVSTAFLMLALGMAAGSPLAGRLSDALGACRTVLAGFGLYAATLALVGVMPPSRFAFLALFGAIGAAGALPSTMMLARIVATWFDARRGLMLGIMAGLGNGLGASIMPAIALWVMAHAGWRATYPVLALLVLVVMLPLGALWLRPAPEPAPLPRHRAHEIPADDVALPPLHAPPGLQNPAATLGQAARRPVFWIIMLTIASGAGCITALIAHLIPILITRGFPVTQALMVMSAVTGTCAIWQVVIGSVMDRARSGRVIIPFYLAALGGLLLLQTHGFATVMAGGCALGVGMGTEFGALPYLVTRYFGLAAYGRVAGAMYAAVMLAQGITPVLMDVSFGRTGTYDTALDAMLGVFACGSVALCALPPYGRTARATHPLPA